MSYNPYLKNIFLMQGVCYIACLLKLDSHLPKKINILFAFMKAFKDDEKCFLFHLNGFIHFIHSQEI